MFEIRSSENEFTLLADGKCILHHSDAHPALFLGCGREKITMYRGNFDISDRVELRVPLKLISADKGLLCFEIPGDTDKYAVTVSERDGLVYLCGSEKAYTTTVSKTTEQSCSASGRKRRTCR